VSARQWNRVGLTGGPPWSTRPRATGVRLVGPDGVLADITRRVLKTGPEVEMSEHLRYETHAPEGRVGGNARNGMRTKTVLTEVGPMAIAVPRDRP
jgi:putative transposase